MLIYHRAHGILNTLNHGLGMIASIEYTYLPILITVKTKLSISVFVQ